MPVCPCNFLQHVKDQNSVIGDATFNPGFNSVLNQHNETEESNTYFLLGENCFEEAQNMIIKFISLRVTDISIELFTEAL